MQDAVEQRFRDEDTALKAEWGAAFESNRNIAADAARKMGWDAKTIDALAGSLGHHKTMNLLKQIGQSLGEAAYVGGKSPTAPMEPAGAKAKIAELMADKDFGARLLNGDADAKATWERLHREAHQGTVNL
jgi:hypothetical protein